MEVGFLIFFGLVIVYFAVNRLLKPLRDKREQEAKDLAAREKPQREAAFFDGCIAAGILDINIAAWQHQALKIAHQCKLVPESQNLFIGETKVLLRDVFHSHAATEEGKEKIQQAQRKLEEKAAAELTAYEDLEGLDKPLAMLNDWKRRMEGSSSQPLHLRQPKKTSDGMIQAGMAAGIGGAVPAMASLASTARQNAAVESYNQGVQAHNQLMVSLDMQTKRNLRKCAEVIQRMEAKQMAPLSKGEVFEKLKFRNTRVRLCKSGVRQTGSLEVTTEMNLSSYTAFQLDGVDYFADGSVVAEIFKDDQKIGEAVLVFPMLGTDELRYYNLWGNADSRNRPSAIQLKGICLFCPEAQHAGPNEVSQYTVTFAPGKHLWALESLTQFEASQIRSL